METTKYPIISSLLDDDMYKFTMGQVAFFSFPYLIVEYQFILRKKVEFPEGFVNHLRAEISNLCELRFTPNEIEYLKKLNVFDIQYINFLSNFQMDYGEIKTLDIIDGNLVILIRGPWCTAIFWEIKLMAIISELYFKLTNGKPVTEKEFRNNTRNKVIALNNASAKWMDFGTRRRFSNAAQKIAIQEAIQHGGESFVGTSNLYFGNLFGINVKGTYAHESIMAIAGLLDSPILANKMWMYHWLNQYKDKLLVALTDTFTTKLFLTEFGEHLANKFQGVRHDSSDPISWAHGMLNHYKCYGINPMEKTLVFSDGLNVGKYLVINEEFKDKTNCLAGIGTNFTNDVGLTPLNMVIKLTSVYIRLTSTHINKSKKRNTVKFSDDEGKITGCIETYNKYKSIISDVWG